MVDACLFIKFLPLSEINVTQFEIFGLASNQYIRHIIFIIDVGNGVGSFGMARDLSKRSKLTIIMEPQRVFDLVIMCTLPKVASLPFILITTLVCG